MLKTVIDIGSVIITGGIVVLMIDVVLKKHSSNVIDNLKVMEERIAISNTNLGYDLDNLVTVGHLEELKKDIKKQVSSGARPKKKKRRGRR